MIPMGFRSKGLGYLGTHGTDGTDYSHCYLLAELNTTPTYAFISYMRKVENPLSCVPYEEIFYITN